MVADLARRLMGLNEGAILALIVGAAFAAMGLALLVVWALQAAIAVARMEILEWSRRRDQFASWRKK